MRDGPARWSPRGVLHAYLRITGRRRWEETTWQPHFLSTAIFVFIESISLFDEDDSGRSGALSRGKSIEKDRRWARRTLHSRGGEGDSGLISPPPAVHRRGRERDERVKEIGELRQVLPRRPRGRVGAVRLRARFLLEAEEGLQWRRRFLLPPLRLRLPSATVAPEDRPRSSPRPPLSLLLPLPLLLLLLSLS